MNDENGNYNALRAKLNRRIAKAWWTRKSDVYETTVYVTSQGMTFSIDMTSDNTGVHTVIKWNSTFIMDAQTKDINDAILFIEQFLRDFEARLSTKLKDYKRSAAEAATAYYQGLAIAYSDREK